jgi:hypothetical protein
MPCRAAILWLVLSSFVLTPFSTLHAHVAADHDHTVLHGGHLHDFDFDDDDHGDRTTSAGHIIDVQLTVSDRSPTEVRWTEWLPLLIVLDPAWPGLPYLTSILRPPAVDEQPIISRPSHWQPPLRGPPLDSIAKS